MLIVGKVLLKVVSSGMMKVYWRVSRRVDEKVVLMVALKDEMMAYPLVVLSV
jgi:hypothetical protein